MATDEDSDEEKSRDYEQLRIGKVRKQQSKQHTVKPSFSAKLLFNLNQIKHYAYGDGILRTREQFEDEVNLVKRKLLVKKMKMIKVRK